MFRTKPATGRRTTQPSPCQTGRTKRASACKVRPSTQSRQLHKFNRTRRPLFVRSDARTNHHQISSSKSERERTTRSSIGRTRSHLRLSRSTRHRSERVDTARRAWCLDTPGTRILSADTAPESWWVGGIRQIYSCRSPVDDTAADRRVASPRAAIESPA